MKKIIFVSLFLLLIGFIPHVFAQTTAVPAQGTSGFTALAPIPGLTSGFNGATTINPTSLASFFNNLYKFLIGLAAILAVIEIIWGGLEISTKDSVSKQSDGRQRITQAILGLVLVLSPVLVFSIINPSILNLSLNLPALNTASGGAAGNGTATQATPATPATPNTSGCTVTGTVLQQATGCPTQDAALQIVYNCPGGYGELVNPQYQNSSGYVGSSYSATCGSSGGTYMFLDTGYYFNPFSSFSQYQPLASANGAAAVNFANTCTQNGGVTCLHNASLSSLISTTCSSYTTPQSTSQSNKCYNIEVTCTPSGWTFGTNILSVCSSAPSWTPIN